MCDKLSFFPACLKDLPLLLRWNLEHAKAYETAKLDWRRVEELLDEKLRLELPDCRAVFRNGEKVGYFSLHRHSDYLELDNFWIFPPFRGQGIGSQVLQYCKGEAERTKRSLRLMAFPKNNKALQLYERAGFRKTALGRQDRVTMEYNPN